MPKIRTTMNPDQVREVSAKKLVDLERWDLVLEYVEDEEEVPQFSESLELVQMNVEGPRTDDESY